MNDDEHNEMVWKAAMYALRETLCMMAVVVLFMCIIVALTHSAGTP